MAVVIAPSILSANHAHLGQEICAVADAGADWVHIDVMDGRFVPNLTLGPPVIASLRHVTDRTFDVHLMIQEPERSVEQYASAGADRITVHAEACMHLHRTLAQIREAGARPGVAINPATPLEAIHHVLHMVDLVLVMTVNPGFGGQSFLPEVLCKVRDLRHTLSQRGLPADIQVDGGIGPTTIAEASAAGANVFVAGSAVFKSSDYGHTIAAMRQAASHPRPSV